MPELRAFEKVKRRFVDNKYDILLQIAIVVSLFVISMLIRSNLKGWIYANYDLSVSVVDALHYTYLNPEAYTWEIFPDAQTYYVEYLDAFKFEQWNPYNLDRGRPLSGYVYGPIFVYGLTFVSYLVGIFFPGLSAAQKVWLSVQIAPLIFDSITTVFIYCILLKRKKEGKRSIINMIYSYLAALIFIFMPLALFYNDTLYLNTYMFTTFTVISLYFLSKDKHKRSALLLAIAILTKLNALFIAPFWLVYVARNNLKKGIEFLIVLVVSYLIFSLPWIIYSPRIYFYQQFWPGKTGNTHFGIEDTFVLWSTTPFHAFLYWAQETGSTFWSDAAVFYRDMNALYLPLLIFVAICCLVTLLNGKNMKQNRSVFFSYTAMYTIGSHIFLSRGNYKYYDPFFIPFVVIAIASWAQDLDKKLSKTTKLVLSIPSSIGKYKEDESKKPNSKTVTKVKTILSNIDESKKFQIAMKVLAFLIFSGVITWIFVLNFWIIFRVKWLHMFYTFLLAVTMIAIFDIKTHITFVDVRNYQDLWIFIKYEYQNFVHWIQTFRGKIKKLGKRKKTSSISVEKIS